MQALHLTVVDEWYEDRYIVVYDISEPGEIKECEVLDLTCTILTSKGDTLYYVRMEGYGEVLKFYQKTVGQGGEFPVWIQQEIRRFISSI